VIHDFADRGGCEVHLRRIAGDADRLAQFSELECDVDGEVLVRKQLDVCAPDRSETSQDGPDLINGRPQGGKGVAAVIAGYGVPRQACLLFHCGDCDPGHHAAAAVGDDPVDLPLLRECRVAERDENRR
jgi:hypothetical protein